MIVESGGFSKDKRDIVIVWHQWMEYQYNRPILFETWGE